MKEIIYNKLIRDKIPEIIDSTGKEYTMHVADDGEFKIELLKKLSEETKEFIENPCEEEIADILEVIDSLVDYYKFSHESIEIIKENKALKRGKFEKRYILESIIERHHKE